MHIPLSKPSLTKADIDAVVEALESNWISSGKYDRIFEEEFSRITGLQNCIAMNSCNSALFVTFLLNFNRRGKVIVPSFGFPPSITPIINAGLTPVLSDVEYSTMNVGPDNILPLIDRDTVGVLVVHLAGRPCEMDEISKITQDHGLFLIEDCAHALGTLYKGRHVGSWGDGCFSFFATKNITTGEGGMLTCRNEESAREARLLISHGISKEDHTNDPLPSRIALIPGYNFRLAGILGALGVSQLNRLEELNRKRKFLAERYTKFLGEIEQLRVPQNPESGTHSWHMYIFQTTTPSLRDWLFNWLRQRSIEVSIHYRPAIHRQSLFSEFKAPQIDYKSSELLEETSITLPLYPDLSIEEQDYVINAINDGVGTWNADG